MPWKESSVMEERLRFVAATRPPGMNSLQQQARFDVFVQEFNAERPHEALGMKCPAGITSASTCR
jgi:hypothetical protein